MAHQLGEARPRRVERLPLARPPGSAAARAARPCAGSPSARRRSAALRAGPGAAASPAPARGVRKLPLNCGSSSSICLCTSSMSARVGRRGGGGGLDDGRLACGRRAAPCRTRTRTSMLCFTSMANSTSTGEPTGSDGSRSAMTICLTTRFSSKIGTTMRPAWSCGAAGAAERRPAAWRRSGATTCLTRCRPRFSTSICSGLVMSCVGSTPWPSGRPAAWWRTHADDAAPAPGRRRRRPSTPGRCPSPAATPGPGRRCRARRGTPRRSGPWPASGCAPSRRPASRQPSGHADAGRPRERPDDAGQLVTRRRACWPGW